MDHPTVGDLIDYLQQFNKGDLVFANEDHAMGSGEASNRPFVRLDIFFNERS